MAQMNALDSLNDEMQRELNEVRVFEQEHKIEEVEELKVHYNR